MLFLIGLSASACSVAKLPELHKLSNTTDPTCKYISSVFTGLLRTSKLTLIDAGAGISTYTAAEFNVGLIATSIPPLKPMFESTLKYFFGITPGSLNSSVKPAYYGARSSLKPSRMTTRHSQHQILPEDSQADLALGYLQTEAAAIKTETSIPIRSVEQSSVAQGHDNRRVRR